MPDGGNCISGQIGQIWFGRGWRGVFHIGWEFLFGRQNYAYHLDSTKTSWPVGILNREICFLSFGAVRLGVYQKGYREKDSGHTTPNCGNLSYWIFQDGGILEMKSAGRCSWPSLKQLMRPSLHWEERSICISEDGGLPTGIWRNSSS